MGKEIVWGNVQGREYVGGGISRRKCPTLVVLQGFWGNFLSLAAEIDQSSSQLAADQQSPSSRVQ